jgi:gamma-glutamyl:cysteine ligase YbdK (ATP-grasp superfamily)
MGQAISTTAFTDQDFAEFRERLRAETALLARWFASDAFARGEPTGGFELECWLVGADMAPVPRVEELLARVDDPQVVPELATFIVEINGSPAALGGNALSALAAGLTATLARCCAAAAGLDARLAMIGILPTVAPGNLTVESMTPRPRYRALNDRILALRHERPLTLHIAGRERLDLEWHDVMLEAAATSFQIHLKVAPEASARAYNASKILSGPLVAIAANSPYLFGRDLWDETRIPLFEQAVSPGGPILEERVSFGFRYARASVLETFEANLSRYPVLLPQLMDEPPENLAHLRLHNGTIWRWNRPLIGFDASGRPHLRIEHRVLPAGPSIPDAIANAALYLGAVTDLIRDPNPPESRLPFEQARTAFYACAREGLGAYVPWLDGRTRPVLEILAQDLLPRARQGLKALGVNQAEIDHWLGIIGARIAHRRTGAGWQRAWVERHGRDMRGLTAAYLEHQRAGRPVHTWTLD